MLWNKDYRVATIFKYCELFSGKKQVICFEKFTFIIVSFLLAINSFVVKIISNFFLAIEIAFDYLVLKIAIAITSFVLKIAFAIAALWLAGSVAVEDKEEREAEQPKWWF